MSLLEPLSKYKIQVACEREASGIWRWVPVLQAAAALAGPALALRSEHQGLTGPALLRRVAAVPTLRWIELGDFWDFARRYRSLGLLEALPELSWLDLGTARSGADSGVTDADLGQLGGLAALQTLRLQSSAKITDGGLRRLARLAGLRQLQLTRCRQLTGRGLQGFEALEQLQLGFTAVHGPGLVQISRLPALADLTLAYCEALPEAQLGALAGVSSLRRLDLDGVSLSNAGLEQLGQLDQLTELRVNASKNSGWINERVTDHGLAHLRSLGRLERLELELGCQVTDAGLEHLAGLQRLRLLNLNYTAVTAAGVQQLQQALPEAKIRWGSTIDEVAAAIGRYFGD